MIHSNRVPQVTYNPTGQSGSRSYTARRREFHPESRSGYCGRLSDFSVSGVVSRECVRPGCSGR